MPRCAGLLKNKLQTSDEKATSLGSRNKRPWAVLTVVLEGAVLAIM